MAFPYTSLEAKKRLNAPDQQVLMGEPASGRRSVAFGVERLALIPFKASAATVLAALVLALLAVLGNPANKDRRLA
jgi:hypothetical protein